MSGWRHVSYAAMLAFVLLATLPLHRFYRLRVFRQPLRLLVAIVPVAALFVAWDLAATSAGHWRFDPAQTLAGRLWGLPLEEYAFFVVVPLAGILTFEAVKTVGSRRRKVPQPASPALPALPEPPAPPQGPTSPTTQDGPPTAGPG